MTIGNAEQAPRGRPSPRAASQGRNAREPTKNYRRGSPVARCWYLSLSPPSWRDSRSAEGRRHTLAWRSRLFGRINQGICELHPLSDVLRHCLALRSLQGATTKPPEEFADEHRGSDVLLATVRKIAGFAFETVDALINLIRRASDRYGQDRTRREGRARNGAPTH